MSVLERVPLEDIEKRAHEIRIGVLLLTLFVGAFWAAGWAARKAVVGLAFLGAAIGVGWREAGPRKEGSR